MSVQRFSKANISGYNSRQINIDLGNPNSYWDVLNVSENATSLGLSWPAAGNSPVSYEISIDGEITNVGNVTSYLKSGLAIGNKYDIKVRPVFSDGTRGAWSLFKNKGPVGYNVATGGTVTEYTLNGITYKVHSFLSSGTFNITRSNEPIDVLYVGAGGAGGAGGGNQHGGGGSGGYGAEVIGTTITPGSYQITIGQPNGGTTTGLGYSGSGGANGPYMAGWAHSGSTNGPSSSIRTGSPIQYGSGAGGYQYNFGASGAANTGNGGQRGTNTGSPGPGSGGSGIFVIRYQIA